MWLWGNLWYNPNSPLHLYPAITQRYYMSRLTQPTSSRPNSVLLLCMSSLLHLMHHLMSLILSLHPHFHMYLPLLERLSLNWVQMYQNGRLLYLSQVRDSVLYPLPGSSQYNLLHLSTQELWYTSRRKNAK
ncbi:hypothetical protein ES707_17538 [subsurface metagenome]